MTYSCTSCGVVWTNKSGAPAVNPVRVPKQTCNDCRDFDWPNTKARTEKLVPKTEKKQIKK